MTALQTEIEARLAGVEPEVEVLLAEVVSGIDSAPVHRPSRRRDAGALRAGHRAISTEYRERYSLEVSSPGQDRPLTKPQHYTPLPRPPRARAAARRARDGPQAA